MTTLAIRWTDNIFQNAIMIFETYGPSFWLGVKITMLVAVVGTVVGMLIGLLIGGIRAIPIDRRDRLPVKIFKKFVYYLTCIYVEVFRGTPMIVQAVFIYYSLKQVFHWNPITASIFIISINTGAYMAEIIRSGIQSVDKGQTEGARSLGLNSIQTIFYIVIPQAIKNSFPAMGNEFVVNIKDSSVLNVIGLTELYFQSNSIAGSVFNFTDTFLVTACIYFVLTFTTTRILAYIEFKMNQTKTMRIVSQSVPHAFN